MSLTRDKKREPELDVRSVLEQLAPVPQAEWRYLERHLRYCELPAGGVVTREGDVATCFGFVVSGVIKKVHVTERGRVVVRGFGGPGSLVGAYVSLLTQQPSYLRVEALRPAELFLVDWSLMPALYARHACWQILGRRIAESMLLEREARAHELLTLSATERYALFCQTHRALLPELRNIDIASYLGISPVSLSRLRARRRRR
jgi:CRP-like cAMP-binding protein